MKILTWNLKRLEKNKNGETILAVLNNFNADILILTETSPKINLGKNYNQVSTNFLEYGYDGIPYSNQENRVTIFSKYRILNSYKTYDPFSSICSDIETPLGILTVYGTIIGAFGGKGERFNSDLINQLADSKKLSVNRNFCIVGDFNVFLKGYAYPSHAARNTLKQFFTETDLSCLTNEVSDSACHIVVQSKMLQDKKIGLETWNEDKSLSDHIGICISIN
jgi:exonuclease III